MFSALSFLNSTEGDIKPLLIMCVLATRSGPVTLLVDEYVPHWVESYCMILQSWHNLTVLKLSNIIDVADGWEQKAAKIDLFRNRFSFFFL